MIRKMIVACILLVGTLSGARDVEETFLRANKYYQDKQYEEAFELYNSIECKGCATWHNMGNSAFRLNKHVDALVYWRKAQRDATAREFDELQKNIDTVYERLGRTPQGSAAGRFIDNLLGRFSLLSLQLLFLVLWFLLFVVIWLTRRHKKTVLTVLIPLNLLLGTATFMKYRSHWNPPAVVVKNSSTIFAGPDQNYHVMGTAHLADELKVIQRRGKWYKVRGNGLAGWALADTLEIV